MRERKFARRPAVGRLVVDRWADDKPAERAPQRDADAAALSAAVSAVGVGLVGLGLAAAVPSAPRAQELPPATRALLGSPDLPGLTFNQNRADRLSRFPDPDRWREAPLAPSDAPPMSAVKPELRGLYLDAIDAGPLIDDAAGPGDRLGRSDAPGLWELASADPSVAPSIAADRVDYGRLAQLVGNDPAAAIAELEDLIEARPEDGRLWQLLGAARLERETYGQAVGALRLAVENGRDSAVVYQAQGDALLGVGKPGPALKWFRKGPDTGRNRLGRATALIQLDQPEEALALLDEAERMDPDLAARVRAIRAGALKLAGRSDAAKRAVARGRSAAGDPSLRRRLDRIARAGQSRERARWGGSFTLESGYNDNVALRSDSAPGSALDEADLVARPYADGYVRLFGTERTRVFAEAGVDGAIHADRGTFDEVFTDLGLRVEHRLAKRWRLSGGVTFEYGNIDGDSYAYIGRGDMTLRWEQAGWSRTALSYTGSYREFAFATAPAEDRDGPLHRAVLTQTFSTSELGAGVQVSPYVSLSREITEGASTKNDGWGGGLDARLSPVDRLDLFAGLGYRENDYDNPHVRTGFAFAREDETWHADAGLSYRLANWAQVGLRYAHVDRDSNIPAQFSYEQNRIFLSATLTWP